MSIKKLNIHKIIYLKMQEAEKKKKKCIYNCIVKKRDKICLWSLPLPDFSILYLILYFSQFGLFLFQIVFNWSQITARSIMWTLHDGDCAMGIFFVSYVTEQWFRTKLEMIWNVRDQIEKLSNQYNCRNRGQTWYLIII